MPPVIKLRNGAADLVTQLNARLWVLLGGQRPTYEQTIDVICANVDDEMLDDMVNRYIAKQDESSP